MMLKPLAISAALLASVVGLAANRSHGHEAPPKGKGPRAAQPAGERHSESTTSPKTKIERALANLGSSDFAVRERASSTLWNAAAEAEPALQKAAGETDDFEVAYRARQLLQSFELGIYPDTPLEIVTLVSQFRMGNFNVKALAARQLKEKGKTELLTRLIARESSPVVREQLTQLLANSGSVGRYSSFDPARRALRARRCLGTVNGGAGQGGATRLRRGRAAAARRNRRSLGAELRGTAPQPRQTR